MDRILTQVPPRKCLQMIRQPLPAEVFPVHNLHTNLHVGLCHTVEITQLYQRKNKLGTATSKNESNLRILYDDV